MHGRKSLRTSIPALSLLYSFLISVGIFVFISLIASVIAYATADPLALIKPLSVAALVLSAICSGYINSRLFGTWRSVLSALIMALAMLTVGIISETGALGVGAMINFASYLASASLFAYLASRRGEKKRRRRR